jgi:hypothetical protein
VDKSSRRSPAFGPREGWRYHHVQAIIVAIDQYAEVALGNRDFFLTSLTGLAVEQKMTFPGLGDLASS